MAGYHFALRCPSCRATLQLSDQDLGTRRTCPRCKAVLQVPEKVQAQQAAKDEEAKHEFSFLCKLCGTRLYGRPSQIGQPLTCPDCQTQNTVPEPAKPKARKILESAGDDYELAPLEERPSPTVAVKVDAESAGADPEAPTPYPIRFACRYCNTLLYANSDAIGQPIVCPDCSGSVLVPNAPPPKPKRRVNLEEAPDIGVSPVDDRPADASIADGLMSSAMERVIEKEKERPDPPKHPFGPGVYGFPFDPMVAAFGLIQCLLFGVSNYLMQMGLESTGREMVIGLFVWIAGGATFLASFILMSFIATNIVTWAAMGFQKIVEWPRFEILDWLRRSLFVFNAFAVSSLPGACIAYLFPGGLWRVVFPLATIYLFFPIVMLSMVSEESPFVPLSGFILQSLGRLTGSWLALYVHTAILSVLVLIPTAAAIIFEPTWMYVSVVITVYALLVYFRFMGNLAYVIDEGLAGYDDEDIEAAPPLQPNEDRGVEPPPIVE